LKVYEFIRGSKAVLELISDLAQHDIMHALKTMPEVAASLAAAAFTLLGMLLALFGLIGNKPTTVSHLSQLS
jgi:calnexin